REDIRNVYHLAYDLGCKGVTVYRAGSREGEVLTVGHQTESDETVRDETPHRPTPRKRPRVTTGQTVRVKTGCGSLYVTINADEQGICEVFTTIGKAGGCAGSFSEATARLISLSLRAGVEPQQVVKQLKGIRCPHPIWQDGKQILSCPDAIAHVLEEYLQGNGMAEAPRVAATPRVESASLGSSLFTGGSCPECSGNMVEESGCATCLECGFSRCS
ncbi:MAG: TSCPD domain-containing protein, partial [Limnochordia bacterium]|nr:TSCPD domain-containing protein [Limnochordia bacterium]